MFYISDIVTKNGVKCYGITDTKDDVQEYYTSSQVLLLIGKGIEINGVVNTSNGVKLHVVTPVVVILSKQISGTPCRLSLDGGKTYKQCLFMKSENNVFLLL